MNYILIMNTLAIRIKRNTRGTLQTCFTPLVKAWQTGYLIEEKTLGTINAAINSALTRTNTRY